MNVLTDYPVTTFYFKCIGCEHRSKSFLADEGLGKGQTNCGVSSPEATPGLAPSGNRAPEAGRLTAGQAARLGRESVGPGP